MRREVVVDWLRHTPSRWQVLPLFALASEVRAKNASGAEPNLLSLSYGKIVRRDIATNSGLLPDSFDAYNIVEQGDIILRLTDLQNDKRSLRVGLATERGIITSAYVSLRVGGKILPAFAYYLLNALDLMKVFYSLGGGVRQTIKFEDLRRIPLPVPPLAEQQAIVGFLDRETSKVDDLIAKQLAFVRTLDEKHRATISRVTTEGLSERRLRDSAREWLGDLPEHWAVRKLSSLTQRIGDGLHGTPEYDDEGGCYFINGNNLVSGRIVITDKTRCVGIQEKEKHRSSIGDNTLLISINGTIGNVALYGGEDIILGKSAAYINCGPLILREYLYFYLQSHSFRSYVDMELAGTTISNLSLESVRGLSVPVPPLDEQREIAKALSDEFASHRKLQVTSAKFAEHLREHRSALITAAVTGQIEVAAKIAAEAAA